MYTDYCVCGTRVEIYCIILCIHVKSYFQHTYLIRSTKVLIIIDNIIFVLSIVLFPDGGKN